MEATEAGDYVPELTPGLRASRELSLLPAEIARRQQAHDRGLAYARAVGGELVELAQAAYPEEVYMQYQFLLGAVAALTQAARDTIGFERISAKAHDTEGKQRK
jgi:hypothetical protein